MRAVWNGKRSESTIHRLSLSSVTDDDRTRTPIIVSNNNIIVSDCVVLSITVEFIILHT